MTYTFDKETDKAASTRTTQYFEIGSNRGIYRDGWFANTTPPVAPWMLNAPMPDGKDYKWEMYNLSEDYSQATISRRKCQTNSGKCRGYSIRRQPNTTYFRWIIEHLLG